MMLNSSFVFTPIPNIQYFYDENKMIQITEEGRKNLKLIMNTFLCNL